MADTKISYKANSFTLLSAVSKPDGSKEVKYREGDKKVKSVIVPRGAAVTFTNVGKDEKGSSLFVAENADLGNLEWSWQGNKFHDTFEAKPGARLGQVTLDAGKGPDVINLSQAVISYSVSNVRDAEDTVKLPETPRPWPKLR